MNLIPEIEAAVQRAVRTEFARMIEHLKDPERLVRPVEARKILGVSSVTMWRMEKRGELPPKTKIGKASGYRLSDLQKIVEGN